MLNLSHIHTVNNVFVVKMYQTQYIPRGSEHTTASTRGAKNRHPSSETEQPAQPFE